ncbi:unnamed protein product, partial [Chrysoparadoxa australica]
MKLRADANDAAAGDLDVQDKVMKAAKGEWPEPLDIPVDRQEWCMSGTDEEVLKVVNERHILTARVITWNLQARPTAGTTELQDKLLPIDTF